MDVFEAIPLYPQPDEQFQHLELGRVHSEVIPVSSSFHLEAASHNTPSHLVPGGYVEFQEFTLPRSDDGTLTEHHALYKSMHHLGEAAAKLNHAFIDLKTIKPMLEKAGFEGVHEYHYKWPSNDWPRDASYKELGSWNHQNIVTGLQGFLMAALTRGLGWGPEEVNVLAAEAKKDMRDRSVHAYWPMIVVTARKPECKEVRVTA